MINSKMTISEMKFKDFPKIMISSRGSYIVLFTSRTEGTLLWAKDEEIGDYLFVGKHDNRWEISHFTDYEGEITLSNK